MEPDADPTHRQGIASLNSSLNKVTSCNFNGIVTDSPTTSQTVTPSDLIDSFLTVDKQDKHNSIVPKKANPKKDSIDPVSTIFTGDNNEDQPIRNPVYENVRFDVSNGVTNIPTDTDKSESVDSTNPVYENVGFDVSNRVTSIPTDTGTLKNESIDSTSTVSINKRDQPTVITNHIYENVGFDFSNGVTNISTDTHMQKRESFDSTSTVSTDKTDQPTVITNHAFENVEFDVSNGTHIPTDTDMRKSESVDSAPTVSTDKRNQPVVITNSVYENVEFDVSNGVTNIPKNTDIPKNESVGSISAVPTHKRDQPTFITNPVYENVGFDISSGVTNIPSHTDNLENGSVPTITTDNKSDQLITSDPVYDNIRIDIPTIPNITDSLKSKVDSAFIREHQSDVQPVVITNPIYDVISYVKDLPMKTATVKSESEDSVFMDSSGHSNHEPTTTINLVYENVRFDTNSSTTKCLTGSITPKSQSVSTAELNSDQPVTVITSNPIYDGVKFNIRSDKDSIISSREFDYSDKEKPKIPDGGWGWVVVVSSLVISMIADGISFSFGLLYSEFLDHFGASKSATSWIGSLFMAVPLLSGPIGSALVDRYGCRTMTILGGIISGFGFVLSTFCNSIFMMYITFGFIAGMGLGLCYVTAVVSIAYWFDKKRTLATSLGACGTGIGTFVYAPLTQFFINEYGWRGTVLLLAGTFFNMCVCGSVMRDPVWWIKEQNKSPSLGNKSMRGSSCGSISGRSTENDFPGIEEIRKLLKSGEAPEYILTALATSMKKDLAIIPEDMEQETLSNFHSVVNLPTFIRQNEKVPMEVLESLSSNRKMFNVILENYPSLLLCRSFSDQELRSTDTTTTRVPLTMSMRLKPSKKVTSPPNETIPAFMQEGKVQVGTVKQDPPKPWMETVPMLRRQFSLKENTHYLKDIKIHRNSVMYRGAMLNIHKYRLRASSCPDIYRNSMTTIARETEETWQSVIKDLFKGMCDFSLFLEWHFMLMSLATILLFIWFIVPYFYLAEHVTHHNMTQEDASIIISVIGITNTIGMVVLGWAGDQPWMNVTKTYSVCLIACGLSTIGMPLCSSNYWALLAVSSSFGIFFASNFSFTPTILVELVPLERFTTAHGLCLLCQGIGNLVGPPIAGFVFDVTQSWDLSFYLAGFWIVISGFLVALIPATNNRKIWGSGPTEKDKDSECA